MQPTAHLMDTSASFTHSTMVVLCRCTACVSTPTTLDSVFRATYRMLLSLQGSQQSHNALGEARQPGTADSSSLCPVTVLPPFCVSAIFYVQRIDLWVTNAMPLLRRWASDAAAMKPPCQQHKSTEQDPGTPNP